MRVLLTGATGFLGAAIAPRLQASGFELRLALRRPAQISAQTAPIADIGPDTDWRDALKDVDAVVHLAALAHGKAGDGAAARAAFQRVNVDGAAKLAKDAAAAGIKTFVFMSSVKAVGEETTRAPWTEQTPAAPQTPYGRSKADAERRLLALAGRMRVVCLRPPLIHGQGVGANFAALMKLAASGLPLPFGGTTNKRSLIAASSVADAVLATMSKANGPSGAFFIADAPALSTGEIVAAIRQGLGRPANLVPHCGAQALAAFAPFKSLFGSLQVNPAAFQAAYGLAPQDSVKALTQTARAWASTGAAGNA